MGIVWKDRRITAPPMLTETGAIAAAQRFQDAIKKNHPDLAH
jgi:hypothetical protein